jgi:hypothetical protein
VVAAKSGEMTGLPMSLNVSKPTAEPVSPIFYPIFDYRSFKSLTRQ